MCSIFVWVVYLYEFVLMCFSGFYMCGVVCFVCICEWCVVCVFCVFVVCLLCEFLYLVCGVCVCVVFMFVFVCSLRLWSVCSFIFGFFNLFITHHAPLHSNIVSFTYPKL